VRRRPEGWRQDRKEKGTEAGKERAAAEAGAVQGKSAAEAGKAAATATGPGRAAAAAARRNRVRTKEKTQVLAKKKEGAAAGREQTTGAGECLRRVLGAGVKGQGSWDRKNSLLTKMNFL
jgi:hypothetical protein